jgi:alpha-galactosidase
VSGKQGGPQVWVRSLANGDKAVVLFNSGSADVAIGVTWASLNCTSSTYAVRNLWNQTDLGHYTGEFNASSIAARDVLLLRISAV